MQWGNRRMCSRTVHEWRNLHWLYQWIHLRMSSNRCALLSQEIDSRLLLTSVHSHKIHFHPVHKPEMNTEPILITAHSDQKQTCHVSSLVSKRVSYSCRWRAIHRRELPEHSLRGTLILFGCFRSAGLISKRSKLLSSMDMFAWTGKQPVQQWWHLLRQQ